MPLGGIAEHHGDVARISFELRGTVGEVIQERLLNRRSSEIVLVGGVSRDWSVKGQVSGWATVSRPVGGILSTLM
jgi:hypothetical protein